MSPLLSYEGLPIDYEPVFAQTKHGMNEVSYSAEYAERNVLLDALVPIGAIPTEVWKLNPRDYPVSQPPDFRVKLQSVDEIFVECTRAGASEVIAFEDTLPDIEAAMNAWYRGEPEAREALGSFSIAFVPQTRPRAREEMKFVAEMKKLVVSKPLQAFAATYGMRAGVSFPLLHSLRTLVMCRQTEYPHISVNTPAMATGGWDEAGLLMLQAARKKAAKGYDGFRPLWLAVGVSNLQWPAADVFKRIQPQLSHGIAPFAKIIFCNSNYAYVATATNEADPQV